MFCQLRLKLIWWIPLVRLAKINLPLSFGGDCFAEKLFWVHSDAPTSWSYREVITGSLQLHWYTTSPPDNGISTWDSYIVSYANTWIVGNGKTTWVLLNLNDGTYTNV